MHFHSDGAFEYNNPTSVWMLGGPSGILAQAKARNMIVLVPLTPDDAPGRFTWWSWFGREENPRYAKDLISYIMGRYKIDRKQIWFSGNGGGAQFVTRYMLPHFGADLGIVGGGFIVFDGGQAPAASFAPYNPPFKSAWHCRWVVGALADGIVGGDGYDAIAAANAGATWFSAQGFATQVSLVAGEGHDLDGWFGPYFGAEVDSWPVPPSLAKVTAMQYNGQTVTEARMMIDGVMTRVFPPIASPSISAEVKSSLPSVAAAVLNKSASLPGDLLILTGVVGGGITVTTPDGWVYAGAVTGTGASTPQIFTFYKKATAGELATVTVNFGGAALSAWRCVTVKDAGTLSSREPNRVTSATTPHVSGGGVAAKETLLIRYVAYFNANASVRGTYTWPADSGVTDTVNSAVSGSLLLDPTLGFATKTVVGAPYPEINVTPIGSKTFAAINIRIAPT
ncbi:hypothetical protein [Rhodococcus globerulus]|uniref:Uncharacterized protein n=1 Tax=Rhodococcus globerulus TaxID=33008 RepID=A0ABU4C5C8_RHOGO|nr:hypothetical protein [Rhodococcus globerulus]MDV6271715.1 hypothetical protein [Rhodococcus globerulus]